MRQISKTRKRLATGAFLIVAGPVALGSVAYACQSLTTLHVNPGTAAAGSTVQVFGKNYSSNVASSPILIRLDTRDGEIIGQFSPRSIIDNQPVTIPASVAAGAHILLATQTTATGNAVSGSPGRADIIITAARTTSQGSAASAAAATSGDPVAATPAAATPASPAVAAVTPAADAAVATVASGPAARTAAPAPAPATTGAAAAAADAAVAADVATTPAAAAGPSGPAGPSAPDAAQVSVGGLLPASSSTSSILPGLTLGAGLALVLLSLAAFIKSSRNVRSDGPLAG